MSFFDFIVDLIWGASELYLSKRKARKAGMRAEAVDKTRQAHENTQEDKCAALGEELADHEKIERLIGQ
jgi:hypothetical protein